MLTRIDNEELLKVSAGTGISLFLGAGFSVEEKQGYSGLAAPTEDELRDELVSQFKKPHLNKLNLDRVVKSLEHEHMADVYRILKERLTVKTLTEPLYRTVSEMALRYIYTTNVDNLVNKIFEDSTLTYLNDISQSGPNHSDRSCVNYVPLHGSVCHEENDLVFTSTDIATAFRKDPDKWSHLSHGIQEYPTIYWGYGLHDSDVISTLSPYARNNRQEKYRWILLFEPDDNTVKYFEDEGFGVIVGDTRSLLEFLKNCVVPTTVAPTSGAPKILKEYLVPGSSAAGTVRPIEKYYLGESPIWNDVWSTKVGRLRYFNVAINDVAANRNLLITGIPVSGKSTLLMQLASQVQTTRTKCFAREINKAKAELIVKNCVGHNVLFFIDNFTDDYEAIQILLTAGNFQLVLADVDYRVTSLSRFEGDKFRVLKISEINQADYNMITSHIPPALKKPTLWQFDPDYIATRSLSVFDLIELNIRNSSAKDRFSALYRFLKAENKPGLDLLLLFAYVNSCRTVVSLDMIISFLDLDIVDYAEIRSLVDSLGAIISEHAGSSHLIDSDQDHYYIRSGVICRTILEVAEPYILKEVIVQFHNNLFPFKIARYDIFQRFAYDADTMARVFPNYAEGKEFYSRIFDRDKNYYLKQQGALYLLRKKQSVDAFNWIDEALSLSGHKNFTIRNSHAVILFSASIENYDDETVNRANLESALAILADCYKHDIRKNYHALKYADFSIRYHDRYHDEKSLAHVTLADRWISEVPESEVFSDDRYLWHLKKRLATIQR